MEFFLGNFVKHIGEWRLLPCFFPKVRIPECVFSCVGTEWQVLDSILNTNVFLFFESVGDVLALTFAAAAEVEHAEAIVPGQGLRYVQGF